MEILRTISLFAEDKNKHFLIIGGHAVNAYGISRQTGDLDLLVRRSDKVFWEKLLEKLQYESEQNDHRFARFRANSLASWPIDLMFVDDDTFSKMYDQANEINDLLSLIRSGVTSLNELELQELCTKYATKQLSHRIKQDLEWGK